MKRLEAIMSLITPCAVFADIGTDHGLIAQFAASRADKVIAADISEKCLFKAKQLLKDYKNVEFKVGDGLKPLTHEAEIIAICGMGGHTIIDILSGYQLGAEFILQPQNAVKEVRKFLISNNYFIMHDFTAYENGKFYDIIKVKRGSDALDSQQLLFGKFYKQKDLLFKERLIKELKKIKSYKDTPKNLLLIDAVQEALNWQK